jgi:hypothetical protein
MVIKYYIEPSGSGPQRVEFLFYGFNITFGIFQLTMLMVYPLDDCKNFIIKRALTVPFYFLLGGAFGWMCTALNKIFRDLDIDEQPLLRGVATQLARLNLLLCLSYFMRLAYWVAMFFFNPVKVCSSCLKPGESYPNICILMPGIYELFGKALPVSGLLWIWECLLAEGIKYQALSVTGADSNADDDEDLLHASHVFSYRPLGSLGSGSMNASSRSLRGRSPFGSMGSPASSSVQGDEDRRNARRQFSNVSSPSSAL